MPEKKPITGALGKDSRYFGPATLALADGRVFRGQAFGAKATVVGEVVFNTSLSGYQEILSDPSYTGQLVCLTAVEIGNVGTNPEDEESDRGGAEALLVRSLSPIASNWRSKQSLHTYMESRGIPGMAEFDTRALTTHLRVHGAVMGAISTEEHDPIRLVERARQAPSMVGRNLIEEVSTKSNYSWDQPTWAWEQESVAGEPDLHVVVFDLGLKRNILRLLRDQGIQTTVVGSHTPLEEVIALKPDGVLLSNGPGDPAASGKIVDRIRELLEQHPKLPVFGICLGHQILCLALGGKSFKLKFGHHGGNHPVRDERDQSVAITSQNHGFAVELESLGQGVELSHLNLFDRTVAGFVLKNRPVRGMQYHPEASPGPHDSEGVFAEFAAALRQAKSV